MREHLETFLAQVEARTGTGLPAFVRDEFEAFLQCGILVHGFLRVRCAECAHEKLVAFSCKRRGFCSKHLVNDTIDHDTLRSYAFHYWTGTGGNKTIEEEILFEGVIDVKQSFDNIENFKSSLQKSV